MKRILISIVVAIIVIVVVVLVMTKYVVAPENTLISPSPSYQQ